MQKRTVCTKLLFIAAFASIAPRLGAFVASGADNELFVTGVASAQANDNVFLSHTNAKSDSIFDLVPGLEYDFGSKSLNKGSFSVNEDFQVYGSESNLDTGLANVAFTSAYDDGKTKLNFDASFHQADQATRDVHQVGVLVKRDLYHADGTGEVSVTEKTSVSTGVIYDDTQYKRAGYANWQWVNVPVKYFYAVEPKLALSAGFTYQNNQLGTGGINSDEYFLNVGARGQFTPKLTGDLYVGYEQLQMAKGPHKNQNGLGVDSNFTYAYTEKTTLTFGVKNDFSYAASGGSSERVFGLNGALSTMLSEQWKANASLSYNNYNYISTTENDNFYNAGVGASYLVNAFVSVTGSYSHVEDSSNLTANSFSNNVFTLSASLKF